MWENYFNSPQLNCRAKDIDGIRKGHGYGDATRETYITRKGRLSTSMTANQQNDSQDFKSITTRFLQIIRSVRRITPSSAQNLIYLA